MPTNERLYVAAAVIASVSVSITVGEFVLSRFGPPITVYRELSGCPYPAVASSYLPMTLPPLMAYRHKTREFDVVYNTNQLGYLGVFPEMLEKPRLKKRVLVCGDSFTLGWGNSRADTFVHVIQEGLGAGYEVINCAYRSGYSPDSYYAYLMREGFALGPRIVVIAIYTENDITDITENRWFDLDERGGPTRVETLRLLRDHQGKGIIPPDPRLWYLRIPLLRESHVFVGSMRLVTRIVSTPHKPLSMKEAWIRFGAVTVAMAALAAEKKVELLYVLIPVDPGRGPPEQLERHQRAAECLAGQQVLDLIPFLAGQEAYFREDGHFNRTGHCIAGEQILGALRQMQ